MSDVAKSDQGGLAWRQHEAMTGMMKPEILDWTSEVPFGTFCSTGEYLFTFSGSMFNHYNPMEDEWMNECQKMCSKSGGEKHWCLFI